MSTFLSETGKHTQFWGDIITKWVFKLPRNASKMALQPRLVEIRPYANRSKIWRRSRRSLQWPQIRSLMCELRVQRSKKLHLAKAANPRSALCPRANTSARKEEESVFPKRRRKPEKCSVCIRTSPQSSTKTEAKVTTTIFRPRHQVHLKKTITKELTRSARN